MVMENSRLRTADMYSLSSTPLQLILGDRIDLSGNRVREVLQEDDLTTIRHSRQFAVWRFDHHDDVRSAEL